GAAAPLHGVRRRGAGAGLGQPLGRFRRHARRPADAAETFPHLPDRPRRSRPAGLLPLLRPARAAAVPAHLQRGGAGRRLRPGRGLPAGGREPPGPAALPGWLREAATGTVTARRVRRGQRVPRRGRRPLLRGGRAMPPAARILDNVAHPLPPVLSPGPGSLDVLVGFLPAWRGVPAGAAASLQAARQTSDETLRKAQEATLPAAGTPGLPAARAAEELAKAAAAASMSAAILSAAGGADKHVCVTLLPVPPHGPGVVIDGSPTVLIDHLPACRMGDTILEAVGPPNK